MMDCITLKATTAADFEDYYKIRCSPADVFWNGYTSIPEKNSFRQLFLQRLASSPFVEPEDRNLYLICLPVNSQEETAKIGFIQLIKRADAVEIGYSVLEAYQGKGYATQALRLGIELARKYAEHIIVRIRDDNVASQKVALKCGFCRTDVYAEKEYPKSGIVKLRTYQLE